VKLVRLGELDVTLEDDQSDELCEIVAKIEDECKDEVENIFHEADTHSATAGNSLRSSWERDKANSKATFFKDQLKNSKIHNFFVGMIILFARKWKCGKPLEFNNDQNRYTK